MRGDDVIDIVIIIVTACRRRVRNVDEHALRACGSTPVHLPRGLRDETSCDVWEAGPSCGNWQSET